MTTREVLISYGYREVAPNKWAKPVGYHLFVFEHKTWSNWFQGADGQLRVYESHAQESEDGFLTDLKTWEAYARINVDASSRADFRLSAIDL